MPEWEAPHTRGCQRAGERTVKEPRCPEDRGRERASGAYEELLPPERLSDENIDAETVRNLCVGGTTAPGGTGSPTVAVRLCRATAGWKKPASAVEFQRALAARRPTRREENILDAWVTEATPVELFRAWAERAYTPRTLAAALRRAGLKKCKAARFLNNFAV